MQPIFDIASKTKVVLIALISLIASPVPTSVVRQPTSAIGQLRELDRQALGAEDAHYAAEYRFQDALAAMMVGDRPVSDGDLAVFKRDEETARSAMEASHQRRDEFVTLLVAHAQDGTTTVAALAALLVDLGKTRNEVKYRSISSDLLDESCVDVLRGQVLFDLSEAVESNDPAKYARALATLGGSTGCMSLMADLRLGADLLTAYERAIERFAEAKKEDARRALVSALANVFMLIQDDVKHVGLNHAHYWLSANRDELVAAFSRSWSIPRRVGLWFKNQTGTRLEPMRPMCESGARDCASATGLLDAMIEGKRIGLGTCDALELASVPWNPSKGYSCDRGLCAGGDGAGLKGLQKMGKEPVPFTPPMKRDAEGYSIPPPGFHVEDGYLEARESLFPKEGHTRYGTEIASLQASLCSSDETSNGSSGVRSFSSKKCAQSMLNASAKGKTLAKLRCVNEVKQRSAEMALNFDAWPMDTCVASVGKNDGEKDNIKPPPSNSTYDKEKLEQAKEAATDWTRANAEKIKETAKKEAGYKVKSTDITAGENAILVVEPMDSRRYDSKHSDPKDPCHGSNACTVGNKIELPMRTVNAKDDDALADILAHEGIHVTLNHTNDKRDRRDDDREIGDRQHKVTCALGKGCDETRYCGPEKDCNECGPGTAQRRALWACLGFDQTTRGPGDADRTTTVINPGPDAVSDTGDSVLGACFGNSSGGAGFPMECAALDCLDGQVPTLVTQQGVQVCKCSTESVRAGRGGVDTCAQIQCGPNERPVMTPNGCGCAPSDGEGTRPVRPSPTPRPGGF